MCGIVGFTGKREAVPVLLAGLARLEYRGYDSAGVATVGPEGMTLRKCSGKIARLAELLDQAPATGTCGIAHTRWATHGTPDARNAHPHADDGECVAVVHNGIIENFAALRDELAAEGHKFRSQTDSEVLPMLIADELREGALPAAAVARALKRVSGSYAVAVLFRDDPGTIICARRGSPVIVGRGAEGFTVASDANALTGFADASAPLDDGDLVEITPAGLRWFRGETPVAERPLREADAARDGGNGKGNFAHYMLKEIFDQPQALAATLRDRLSEEEGDALLPELNFSPRETASIGRVVVAACGTSLHAGLIGEYLFEALAALPSEVEQAAEFRYRNPILTPDTLVIPISQSGETADTLAALREAKRKGALVGAITNVPGSTIAREAERAVDLRAGTEISVASTKAFTCQVATLGMIALHLARVRQFGIDEGKEVVRDLAAVPGKVARVLEEAENIRRAAEKFAEFEDFFFIGRGVLYPVALEGALKLKEISYVHAEGCHAAELKHGPISQLCERTPVIALANRVPGREKLLGNLAECQARRAPVIALITEGEEVPVGCLPLRVPDGSPAASTIFDAVVLQLFAYYYALKRGCEIDQPRNLAKSVTVE